jgi:A/G-specific adenine glycosylase
MKAWQGLGYYTRARKMQEAAKMIQDQYDGMFPDNYSDLLKIPGIGPYTAAAVASFAFKEVVPVVDGNVIRVLARLFGLFLDPGSAKGKHAIHQRATEIIDPGQPDIFNQAIMEFGATHCLPRNPKCTSCPLSETCHAFTGNMVDKLPVRKEKKSGRMRYFHYLVLIINNQVLLRRREQNDIWRLLYEFPLAETLTTVPPEQVASLPEFRQLLGNKGSTIIHFTREYKHTLTHQQIFARFYLVCMNGETIPGSDGYIPVGMDRLPEYPVPRLIDRFLKGETWSGWKSGY